MFGTRWLAMLFGFAFFSHQVGGFLGVWLGGIVFERTGSYNAVWWLACCSACSRRSSICRSSRSRCARLAPRRHDRGGGAMTTFKAIVIDKAEAGRPVRLTDFDEKDLMDGDVTFASNSRR